MRANNDTSSSAHITDSEVAAAIRYLDPVATCQTTRDSDDTVIVVAFTVLTFALAAVPFISLYLRTS
jgi:hypothetical protein